MIIHIMIVLIVVGVLLWAANTYIPMDGKIKQVMNIAVVLVVVLWLISVFLPGLGRVTLQAMGKHSLRI